MNEEQIRQIVKDEFWKNYNSGSPDIPPHTHNGNDNLVIPLDNITGAVPVQGIGNGLLSWVKLGSRIPITAPNGKIGNAYLLPLLTISGDLGAESLPFTEAAAGDAPDGTLLLYKEAAAWQLWISLFGSWHGVDLPLTPTP